jgi:hypothetical protein
MRPSGLVASSALVVALVTAVVVTGLATAAGITLTSGPTIPDCGSQALSPAAITLACGDGNYGLAGFKWQHWGAATSYGSGSARANDCTPDCAAGTFHSYDVLATASSVRTCRSGRKQYTKLVLHYVTTRPKGIGATDTWKFACDAAGPGPTLTATAKPGNRLLLAGAGWPLGAGCSSTVSVGFNDKTTPFASPKIGSGDGFALLLMDIRAGAIIVGREQCTTAALGARLYESAITIKK